MISFGGGQGPAGGRFLSAADNARLADNARPGRDGGWTGGSDENIKKEATRAAGRVPRSPCLKHKEKRNKRTLFCCIHALYTDSSKSWIPYIRRGEGVWASPDPYARFRGRIFSLGSVHKEGGGGSGPPSILTHGSAAGFLF